MSSGFVDIGFEVMGEAQIARSFLLAEELSHDMSEPLGALMDQILDSVRAQFESEGTAAHGAHWAALSDEYAIWKAEHFPGRQLLVREGGMKGAMLNKALAVQIGLTEAVYEPRSEIAGFHQSGAEWIGPAWGHGEYAHHLPQRKMVELSEAFKHEAVDREFARWIAAKLAEGRAGAGVIAA